MTFSPARAVPQLERSPIDFSNRPGAAFQGILLALMGIAFFSFMFALPKLAGPAMSAGDVPGLQIAFTRYLGGFLMVLPLAAATRRNGVSLVSPQPQWHLFRAGLGVASVVFGVYAVTHMPLADASAIGLTSGVFAILLAFIFFGERLSPPAWQASLLCLAGALVVARPSADLVSAFQNNPAALIALAGAITMAGEVAILAHVSRREPAARVLLHMNGFADPRLAGTRGLLLGRPGAQYSANPGRHGTGRDPGADLQYLVVPSGDDLAADALPLQRHGLRDPLRCPFLRPAARRGHSHGLSAGRHGRPVADPPEETRRLIRIAILNVRFCLKIIPNSRIFLL